LVLSKRRKRIKTIEKVLEFKNFLINGKKKKRKIGGKVIERDNVRIKRSEI